MNITIPNSGFKVGTCGWLAKGLTNGSIKLEPGQTKDKKPGLWLSSPNGSQLLALFNPYDLADYDLDNQDRFFPANDFDAMVGGGRGKIPFTDACWDYLMQVASEWCDNQNSRRSEDDDAELLKLEVRVCG